MVPVGGAAKLALATLLLVGTLVGCGGAPAASIPDTTTPAPPAVNGGETGTQAALEQAARSSFEAFLGADDQAYFDMLSRECRELGFAAVESHLVGRRSRAVDLGGIDLSAVAVSEVVVEDFTGSTGEVSLVLSGTSESFSEGEPHDWQFEEGAWRLADCSDMRESPNDLTGRGTDRNEPLALGDVVQIGGWFVSLVYVDQDVEETLADDEVEPAAAGNQLVSAQLLVNYNGAEPSVVIGEHMSFAMVANELVLGDEAACQSDLAGLFYDPTTVATPGEDLPRPLVCREVPSSVAGEMLLRLTHTPTGTEYWFDLSQV